MEIEFFKVVFAHFIGDFFFQNSFMADNKRKNGVTGFLWCSVHVLVYTTILLLIVGDYSTLFFLGVYIPHWVIDRWSLAYQWMKVLGRGGLLTSPNQMEFSFGVVIYVVMDQTAHLLCLYILIKVIDCQF